MILTAEAIKQETGFTLGMSFPNWQRDGGAHVQYHEEHERLSRQFGPENVFGSLFFEGDENRLVLGLFVRHREIIQGELAGRRAVAGARRELEGGRQS